MSALSDVIYCALRRALAPHSGNVVRHLIDLDSNCAALPALAAASPYTTHPLTFKLAGPIRCIRPSPRATCHAVWLQTSAASTPSTDYTSRSERILARRRRRRTNLDPASTTASAAARRTAIARTQPKEGHEEETGRGSTPDESAQCTFYAETRPHGPSSHRTRLLATYPSAVF